MDMNISLMDQRRFIQQRESSAFVHSRYSYGSQTSVYSGQSGASSQSRLGSRLRRCFRWCFFNNNNNNRRHRSSSNRKNHKKNSSRRKSNTSTRDKIIEYRRKQSTFVPLTLAKPQEDFASHAILMPNQSGQNSIISGDDINFTPQIGLQLYDANSIQRPLLTQDLSDYGHSSRSSAGDAMRFDGTGLVTGMGDFATNCNEPNFTTNESNDCSTSTDDVKQSDEHDPSSDRLLMMKCSPALNAADDDCSCCNDDDQEEKKSQLLSSQADLGFYTDTYYNTHTSSSSNDTLKHIVDECINEQVSAPLPTSEYLATLNAMSPEISLYQNVDGNGLVYGDNEYEISSPTASVDVDNQIPPECPFDDQYTIQDEQQMQELFDNLAIGDINIAREVVAHENGTHSNDDESES